MKKLGLTVAAGAIALAFASGPAFAHHVALLGNGLPHITGKVEKLLLRASPNCTDQEFDDSNRNSILLQIDYVGDDQNNQHGGPDGTNASKINDIYLTIGGLEDFVVIDGNACPNAENDGAEFTLPDDIATDWTGFMRLVGTPDSNIDIAACYTDGSNDIICETSHFQQRGSQKPSAQNVTNKLLKPLDDGTSPFWEAFVNGKTKAWLYFYPDSELYVE